MYVSVLFGVMSLCYCFAGGNTGQDRKITFKIPVSVLTGVCKHYYHDMAAADQ